MLRPALLAAARSTRARAAVERTPLARPIVDRFVAGCGLDDAIRAAHHLVAEGCRVTVDHLGENTAEGAQAAATVDAYLRLLAGVRDAGLAGRVEASVKLSAVGQFLPTDGEKIALDNARRICEAAAAAGTTVTLDMEDHSTIDSTLGILHDLRVDFPWVGAVLQSRLRRTETDCRELATTGSRVRLCKGAYREPAAVAFTDRREVDLAYVRCLGVLMSGQGYPMVASHDPRMVAIAEHLATQTGRTPDSYEFQMLYGVRPREQRRIAARDRTMRVYLPYGEAWYGYFMRRLAERPANVGFFLRALASTT
jgi:proline dehydrogenase